MFEQAFKKIDDILRKDAGVSSERDYSYDFVHAHEKFNDPEWDGPPLEPEPAPAPRPPQPPAPPSDGEPPMVIRLADGKAREIQHMTATSFFIALRKEHHSRLKQVAMNLL